jgi:PKD repeat protein
MLKLLLASCILAAAVSALPVGFQDEIVAHISKITSFTFVPKREGGTVIFAVIKKGLIKVLENPDTSGTARTIFNISDKVCNNGERGMHQALAHPDFLGTKRWVYISYTFKKFGGCRMSETNGAVNRFSRFLVNDDYSIDQDSETVLLETAPLLDQKHNGGDMMFGDDGYLYVTFGDGGNRDNSKDLGTVLGKILRLTEDGAIPPDNPFRGTGTARCNQGNQPGLTCQEIFSYGFRHPFRFSKDPNTNDGKTHFYVGDVGGDQWEEISKGGTDFAGRNFGFPDREGPCSFDSITNCTLPSSSAVDPIFWYAHNNESAAVTGVAPVPNGLWPGTFNNTILYCDYPQGKMYVIQNDVTPCRTCIPPRSSWSNHLFHDLADSHVGMPVQLLFGPYKDTQALYYTARTDNMNIRRIYYVDGATNPAPSAQISASSTSAPVGSVLKFDGSMSSDPDGGTLLYQWDFGDGTTASIASPIKTFDRPGNFDVKCTVTAPSGLFAVANILVNIGAPPTPAIVSPAPGSTFAVGDVLTLIGTAVDGDGTVLSASSLTWEVRLHHNTHTHPFLDPTSGNNIMIDPAPSPEDLDAATKSYLEVLLTATDRNGYAVTTNVTVMPQMVTFSFESNPSGLTLLIDGYPVRTPVSVTSWVNHRLTISAYDQDNFSFQSWNNGKAASHVRIVKSYMSMKKFTATFRRNDCYPKLSMCTAHVDCCSGYCSRKGICRSRLQ